MYVLCFRFVTFGAKQRLHSPAGLFVLALLLPSVASATAVCLQCGQQWLQPFARHRDRNSTPLVLIEYKSIQELSRKDHESTWGMIKMCSCASCDIPANAMTFSAISACPKSASTVTSLRFFADCKYDQKTSYAWRHADCKRSMHSLCLFAVYYSLHTLSIFDSSQWLPCDDKKDARLRSRSRFPIRERVLPLVYIYIYTW